MIARTSPRSLPASTLVHVLSLLLGFVTLMVLGRNLWFTADEWDFIVDRGFHDPVLGWMVPHSEHWSALPIVIWRALFTVFGLHHYWPYFVFVVLAHLLAVHMVWRIAGRLGVDPWLSTIFLAASIPLGVGAENLLFAFQVGFVGSVAFGLAAVWLAMGLRPGWRQGSRLLAVWAVAVLGLTCSGVGVTMVVAATLTALLAVGWRPAVLVGSVPALVYVLWYAEWGEVGVAQNSLGVNADNAHLVPDFVYTGFKATLGGWIGLEPSGPFLLLILAVIALRHRRGVAATPLALLIASVVFFTITSLGRVGLGAAEAAASRYSYIAMFLLLPTILVGFDLVLRRRRLVLAGGLAVALAASGIVRINTRADSYIAATRLDQTRFIADVSVLRSTRRTLVAAPIADDPNVTSQNLLALSDAGQLTGLPPVTPADLARAHLDLQVYVGRVQVRRDRTLRLTVAPGVTPDPFFRACAAVVSTVPVFDVTLTVGGATSSVAVIVPVAEAMNISLAEPNAPLAGPNVVQLAAGVNWVRVADPHSMLTLGFPVGTAQLCHVTTA